MRETLWDVIVVDYSCPDGTHSWATSVDPRVSCVRAEAESDGRRPLFNLARARHLGASEVSSEWMAFVDADVILSDEFSSWISPRMSAGTMVVASPFIHGAAGFLCMRTEDYFRTGGLDLGRTGYGPEEYELRVRARLMLGLRVEVVPPPLISSIPHGNRDRMKNYARLDLAASRARLEQRIVDQFGLTLKEASAADPVVRTLLGGVER